ncbi:MAG: hypothetical protein E6I75_23535 [Chloroflexi bacterium]|nr:MAG: hypothetical protein E6I75_23535 [Chloroflexota bacterium]
MAERLVTLSRPTSADEVSLLELADRLLNRGVVLSGEATILGLNVVLTTVENLYGTREPAPARDHTA